MPNLLRRSSWRYAWQHPWLMGLSVLGVALGVAMVVSIDLANTSAERAFEQSAARVTGKATHQVVGAATELDEAAYAKLRVEAGVRDIAPVVEGYASVPGASRTLHVLGVDAFAEAPFRPYVGGAGSNIELSAFMATPNTALLAQPTADALGKTLGDTLAVRIGGKDTVLRIVGELVPDDDRSAQVIDNLLVVDIATAQELFGMTGHLSRIDLLLPDNDDGQQLLERIEAALPTGAEVTRSTSRTRTVEQMTRAFNLNLTALSLLALVVGMFLIYNTMTFSVVQRRPLLGRLRALGVTRREIFRLILGEAAVVAVVGTALGLGLGIVLGNVLVRLVTQTINDLYYVLTVRELSISAFTLLKGTGLGLGATLLATIPPAREATRAPASTVLQRSQQESNLRDLLPRLIAGGVVLALLGGGLLFVPSRSIVLSYAALLLIIVAAALLTPAAVWGLAKALRPVLGAAFGVLGRMAARGVVTTLSRTAVAVAALMIAIAATIGVGVMVDSFRETVAVWLGYTLRADVYVQAPSLVFRRTDTTLDPGVVERLKNTEGVAGAYSVRSVTLSTVAGRTEVGVIDQGPSARRAFRFKSGDPEVLWRDFQTEDVLLISEPYSYRTGLRTGDTLELPTDEGARAFTVGGVFYDYASDLGVVLMSRPVYERHFDDRALSGLALYAAEGQDVAALVERLRDRAGTDQELIIRSNRALREASLEVFDRTFTVTIVLRLLAVLVAFVGVVSALMALQLERARELAVLRANGLTPRQVWRYVTLQTGTMGLIAGLLSVPLGLVLASVLIYVINKRSFGWTLQFEIAPEVLLQALVLALVAALLAGLYPSYKMARANPARALREE